MTIAPARTRSQSEQNVVPLVNIVFLLLIFFMLAGRIAASGPFPVQPPPSTSGGDLQPAELKILVAADGRLALNGAPATAETALEHVRAGIASDRAVRITVKADGAAASGPVLGLLDRFKKAGIRRVVLIVEDTR
jgi:biopolymer transport protein ExbD